MAKSSSTALDSALRRDVFSRLNIASLDGFQKINDRQYGILLTDADGVQRYVRVGAIVAEVREDMTAADLMASEVEKYRASVAKAAEKKAAAKAKAEKDKADREAKAAAKAAEAK